MITITSSFDVTASNPYNANPVAISGTIYFLDWNSISGISILRSYSPGSGLNNNVTSGDFNSLIQPCPIFDKTKLTIVWDSKVRIYDPVAGTWTTVPSSGDGFVTTTFKSVASYNSNNIFVYGEVPI